MRTVLVLVGILVVVVAAGVAVAYRPALNPVEPKEAASFDRELVVRGARLADIGNCITCHTSEDGASYGGGYPVATPFGTVYGTNITPDPETGIGRWSEEAFIRAMREGVARDGGHLYPAFPYTHFTKATDEDLKAIYAFLMTRQPVRADTPENDLAFPFNIRLTLAGWNLLFLDEGPYQEDPERSREWNHGAYLVEGLGHCGACHTPRSILGAEQTNHAFSGGQAQGWHAPALDSSTAAPVPWDAEAIAQYLHHGWHELHGAAAGPMADVAANLADVPEEDIRAMAVYTESLADEPTAAQRERAARITAAVEDRNRKPLTAGDEGEGEGAKLFAGACATCHEAGRDLDLALSTAVHAPDAHNFLRFVLEGVQPEPGRAGPFMPGFADAFTDEQLVTLASYVRKRFSDQAAWENRPDRVRELRRGNN